MPTPRLKKTIPTIAAPSESPQAGFGLAEFLVVAAAFVIIGGAALQLLGEIQAAAATQSDSGDVIESARTAMDTVTRTIRQAGNDPLETGFDGVTTAGPSEIRLRSDITGSAGAPNPDKGDPDGDTSDSGEDVTIRHNVSAQTLELIHGGGSAQPTASGITRFQMEYLDDYGGTAAHDGRIRIVRVSLTATAARPDRRTGRPFSVAIARVVEILSRQ